MQNNEALIVLDELVKLANIQDERMLAMRAQERKSSPIVSVDCCSLGFLVADRQLA